MALAVQPLAAARTPPRVAHRRRGHAAAGALRAAAARETRAGAGAGARADGRLGPPRPPRRLRLAAAGLVPREGADRGPAAAPGGQVRREVDRPQQRRRPAARRARAQGRPGCGPGRGAQLWPRAGVRVARAPGRRRRRQGRRDPGRHDLAASHKLRCDPDVPETAMASGPTHGWGDSPRRSPTKSSSMEFPPLSPKRRTCARRRKRRSRASAAEWVVLGPGILGSRPAYRRGCLFTRTFTTTIGRRFRNTSGEAH